MTKVSIIIPTLNRAHILKFALKSAVEQDYKDLEIIVCDDFSDDNTKEVVGSFNNKNIVYIRADKRLNATDNFEFALSKATGEYVTFLTDTYYLLPKAISMVMDERKKFDAEIVMWKNCSYCSPDWLEPERRNTLQIPRVTSKSCLLDSGIYLHKFYDNIRELIIPKSINSLCHKSVIKKAINIQGSFFTQPIPDHNSAVSMLINTQNFLFIDKVLFIGGVSPTNTGASLSFNFGKGYQSKDFLKGSNQKLDEVAFLGIPVTSAYIIKGLENVKRFYPDCPAINIKNALSEITDSLAKLQIYGANVKDYWQILNDYVSKNCRELRGQIIIRKLKSLIKWSGVKIMRSNRFLYNFEAIIRRTRILKGDRYGFNNIEGAAKIVERFNSNKNLMPNERA
jgi:glycosyltransferase involved in cell wall biosynthesis